MSANDATTAIKDKIKVLSDKQFFRPVAPAALDEPPLAFNFSYAGMPFLAEVEQGPRPTVSLKARLAPLPFSAESPELRARLLELIRDSGPMTRGRLVIDHRQDLWLAGTVEAGSAANPVAILAAAVTLILDMKPYLETMTRLFETLHEGAQRPEQGEESETGQDSGPTPEPA